MCECESKLGFDECECERREQWQEIERNYRKLSSQQTVIFLDVTLYKALCLPFICRVKGLQEITSCFVTLAGVKWQLRSFKSHTLIKVKYKSSEDECGITLSVLGTEASQEQPAKEEGGV